MVDIFAWKIGDMTSKGVNIFYYYTLTIHVGFFKADSESLNILNLTVLKN